MRPAAQMLLLQTTTPEFRYSGGGVPKGAVIITALALLYLLPSMLMVWAYEAPADSEPTARP